MFFVTYSGLRLLSQKLECDMSHSVVLTFGVPGLIMRCCKEDFDVTASKRIFEFPLFTI